MKWGICVFLFSLTGTTACSGGAPGLPSTGADEGTPTAKAPGVTFEILSPGAMPRQPLRHVFRVGEVENGTQENTGMQRTSVGDRAMPDVKLPLARVRFIETISHLTPDGNAAVKYEVQSVDVLPAEGAAPRIVAQQRAVMSKRAGTTVQSELTPQGEPVDYVRRFASTMDAEDVEELEQFVRVDRAACSRFPPMRWATARSGGSPGPSAREGPRASEPRPSPWSTESAIA